MGRTRIPEGRKGDDIPLWAQIVSIADVYDALVSEEILCQIPDHVERIYVGKRSGHHPVPQEEINAILLQEAQKGKRVLRLKGGDPFVFGRGGEELELLTAHQIPYEIVPGVTSASAVRHMQEFR
mgnify:CR=1 FL=1